MLVVIIYTTIQAHFWWWGGGNKMEITHKESKNTGYGSSYIYSNISNYLI